jgi:undecaprenyl-diphosphatase
MPNSALTSPDTITAVQPTETFSRSPGGFANYWKALDVKALHFLHGLRISSTVTWALILFVRIGDGWLWAGIAAWLWVALPWATFKQTVVQCLLAVGISLLLYWPLKFWTKRIRPYLAFDWVTRKVPPLDKYSFPSGHTMNNLAVSLTLASLMPSWYAPAIGVPLALGVLRVVFGVHFLSDILAGAALGALSHLGAKAVLIFVAF